MQKKKIIKTHKITLDLEEIDVIKAIECGFKIDWLTLASEDRHVEIRLYAGAGCGNTWIQVGYKEGKDNKYYRLDVSKIAEFVGDLHASTEEIIKSRGDV